jgi:hypothetical protein
MDTERVCEEPFVQLHIVAIVMHNNNRVNLCEKEEKHIH